MLSYAAALDIVDLVLFGYRRSPEEIPEGYRGCEVVVGRGGVEISNHECRWQMWGSRILAKRGVGHVLL